MNRCPLPLVLALLSTACAHGGTAYRQPPPEPSLSPAPQDDRAMYLSLIRRMQEQGAYYASLAHIEAFRKRFGDAPELRIAQADALRETGDGDGAATLYRSLVRGAQAAPAWHGLGLVAAASGDRATAEQALGNAVQLEPLNPGYLGDLGFALLQSGRTAEARAPLAKAAELAPDSSRAAANLALWALLSGQSGLAETIMRGAGLSTPVRDEVVRLYGTLRSPPAPSQGQSQASAPPASAVVAGDAVSRPPGSMLERFAPASDRSDEVLP